MRFSERKFISSVFYFNGCKVFQRGNGPSKTSNPSTKKPPNCGGDPQLLTPHSTEKNKGFASAERNSVGKDRQGIG